jgi:putative hemolysin
MEVFILLILILINGVFSMSEIALVSVRKVRLEQLAHKGDEAARTALKLANNPTHFLSTVQIGITITGILLGLFSGDKTREFFIHFISKSAWLRPYSKDLSLILVVLIVTYFTMVLGELVPKRIGLARPEGIAKIIAPLMNLISIITFPFIWLLTASSNVLVKILGIRPATDNAVTEEEIKAMLDEGTSSGNIEETEQQIIERVFHLGDRNITSLMTHRTDIIWVDIHETQESYRRKMAEQLHSIYPVCDGQIDKLLGVIHIKELFLADPGIPLSDLLKKPLFIPEANSPYLLMEMFKKEKVHFAFIVDEYGSLLGMITINDLLEAVLGDMPQPDEKNYGIIKSPDGSYLVDAQIPFYDFLLYFDKGDWVQKAGQDFDTVAGFLLHHLQHIPQKGEKLEWRGFSFQIAGMEVHRIDQVIVKLIKPATPAAESPKS